MKQKARFLVALLLVTAITAVLLCGCRQKTAASSGLTGSVELSPPLGFSSENEVNKQLSAASGSSAAGAKGTTGSAGTAEKSAAGANETKVPAASAAAGNTASALQGSAPQNNSTPSSFTACSTNIAGFGTFQYWLYKPANPTKNMPLIVYLHGGTGKGSDLNLITAVDGFPKYLQSGQLGEVGAYVIIPQLPSAQKGWVNVANPIYNLIHSTVSAYDINKNNISLTGHSMGGTGTWELACAYPNLFARIAPLSGSVRNTAEVVSKLKSIPVRAFVGSDDKIVPPNSSKDAIAALKAAGANAEITVFNGADHFSVPGLAFLNKSLNLVGWLIGG